MAACDMLLLSLLPGSHRNISCLSLRAALVGQNIACDLLFIMSEQHYNSASLADFVARRGYRFIGVSVMTGNFHFAGRITADLKRLPAPPHIIWGGIHPTMSPEECLDHCDIVCLGEGDISFPEVIRCLRAGTEPTAVPGLALKDPDGVVRRTGAPPLVTDLDSLPFVRYDFESFYLIDDLGLRPFLVSDYAQYSNYSGHDYTLMATRSCPFSCSYCCNSFLNELNGKARVRKRSVEHVIAELRHARATLPNVRFINFIDDQFLTNRKWTAKFAESYASEIGLPFIVRLVPGTFGDEEIRALRAAGLTFAQVGIQSGSRRTHDEVYHRKFNREVIIETSRILSRNGIHPFYDVIIHSDLETDEDREQTIRLFVELAKPFSMNVFALTPFPRTPLAELYDKHGIDATTDPYGDGYVVTREDEFFFQLLSITPYTEDCRVKSYLARRNSTDGQAELAAYYHATADRRRLVTFQERLPTLCVGDRPTDPV